VVAERRDFKESRVREDRRQQVRVALGQAQRARPQERQDVAERRGVAVDEIPANGRLVALGRTRTAPAFSDAASRQ